MSTQKHRNMIERERGVWEEEGGDWGGKTKADVTSIFLNSFFGMVRILCHEVHQIAEIGQTEPTSEKNIVWKVAFLPRRAAKVSKSPSFRRHFVTFLHP